MSRPSNAKAQQKTETTRGGTKSQKHALAAATSAQQTKKTECNFIKQFRNTKMVCIF